jgi:hypothetical protein
MRTSSSGITAGLGHGDFSTQHVEWQLTHLRECTADHGSCRCPPEPEGPIEPTLTIKRKTNALSVRSFDIHMWKD